MEALVDKPEDTSQSRFISGCGLSVLSGTAVTLWSARETTRETRSQWRLTVRSDLPVIIGRAEGRAVAYLDPAYRPTTIVPGTGRTILQNNGDGSDDLVSRAHFMLRAVAKGLVLVNGVPQRGGGIRPPLNWTLLCAPVRRFMEPCEEYCIALGSTIELLLPNKSQLRIDARSLM